MSTKISELTEVSVALTGAEELPIVQSGTTYKVPAEQLGGAPAGVIDDSGSIDYSRGTASAVKNSTGNYTVTFSSARPLGTWLVTPTLVGTGSGTITWEPASTTAINVYTFTDAGVAADRSFSFAVVVIG